MSRNSTRAAQPAALTQPEGGGPGAAPAEPVLLSLREHPFVVAGLALAAAVAAVARFPNQPVPASLVDRIDVAQRALSEAAADIDQGFFTPELTALVGEPIEAEPYDDAWIKERLASLDEALKGRFEAVDASIRELAKPVAPADPA